jgi:hypothetical protein
VENMEIKPSNMTDKEMQRFTKEYVPNVPANWEDFNKLSGSDTGGYQVEVPSTWKLQIEREKEDEKGKEEVIKFQRQERLEIIKEVSLTLWKMVRVTGIVIVIMLLVHSLVLYPLAVLQVMPFIIFLAGIMSIVLSAIKFSCRQSYINELIVGVAFLIAVLVVPKLLNLV